MASAAPSTVLAPAKRPRTFAAAASAGPRVIQTLRIVATGSLAARMRKMLEPKNTRPLRFCLRADRAFSGEDFSSLPLSTVRAAFTTALQHVARSLDMDAQACIMDHRVSLHVCKSQQSCFYLMEAVCSPAFAEAAIAHLRPCGGIIPMQLGRRTAAYAMRYEGENFAAAPFVLSFASAGGDLSMAHEGAAAFCCDYLQQFHIEPIWAVAVDAAGAVRSFHGLASTEEAARFPATRPRPAVSTCYVLVPGTRRAHDLVATLYQSRNVVEIVLDASAHELQITRLLARLPAAPSPAAGRATGAALPPVAPQEALPPVAETEGEETADSEQPGAVTTSGTQRGAAANNEEQPEAAVTGSERPGAATTGGGPPVAAASGGVQMGTAIVDGEQPETAVVSGVQLEAAADVNEQPEAAEGDGQRSGAEEEDMEMAFSPCPTSDEDEPFAEAGGDATEGGWQTPSRHGKQKGRRSDGPLPESKTKLPRTAGHPSKVKPKSKKHGTSATQLLLTRGDAADPSTSSA